MSETNGHREQLEQRAAEVRSRLEQHLHSIDERGHRIAEVARAAARPPASIIIMAAAGIAATLFIVHRVRARRARTPRWADLLSTPPPPRQRGLLAQGLEKAAASLVTVAVQRLGRRGLDHLLAEPLAEAPPEPATRAYY